MRGATTPRRSYRPGMMFVYVRYMRLASIFIRESAVGARAVSIKLTARYGPGGVMAMKS